MNAALPIELDVAIVGGGMVGASLALALSTTPLRVALIEAEAFDAAAHSSFDGRTSALGNGTRRIFETLGVWAHMAPHAAPVREIHVSDAGRAGAARISAREQGLEALGYVLPNRQIGAALWQALKSRTQVRLQVPARVLDAQFDATSVRLQLDRGGPLSARVVVAADGAGSVLRARSGIGALVEDYRQVAVVTHVGTDRAAGATAYERFTSSGPLAVLPLADGRYTVVWTLAPQRAAEVLALDDVAFLAAMQQCFGWRIGRLVAVGARASYPLQLSRAERLYGPRLALVGNAAQALHPVAGQGFNLGLRDAALLAQLLAEAPDPGAPAVLETYQRRRLADRRGMIGFTDSLVKLFASEHPALALARGVGLQLFDVLPGAKQALSRISWGFGGDAPRLMRGLPVSGGTAP